MRIFISGGCKNGKSSYAQLYAQRLAKVKQAKELYYVATMQSTDHEDDERIERHRQERAGLGFTTVEQPVDIESIVQRCDPNGSFLLDSLTALLANEMFPPGSRMNEQAAEKISNGLSLILDKIENIVLVSDYIYSDAMFYDPFSEKYRKSLADIDRTAARLCDVVLEVAYTQVIVHKGREAFDALFS